MAEDITSRIFIDLISGFVRSGVSRIVAFKKYNSPQTQRSQRIIIKNFFLCVLSDLCGSK
jgi:hypothetical protein